VQAAIVTPAERAHVVVVESIDSVFTAHYGRLVRALTVVSGNREMAADAVQEAFVAAHLHWRRIRRYEDPVGWIRRVAINKLRDEGRRQRRRRKVIDRLEAEPETTSLGGIGEPSSDVVALLAELPRQQRIAVALHYVDDLPISDIAAAMGLSEGAVKFHLHQGRARLRGSAVGGEL
jgi:RNA polymerase sigma-70 factor, ECF subfamily